MNPSEDRDKKRKGENASEEFVARVSGTQTVSVAYGHAQAVELCVAHALGVQFKAHFLGKVVPVPEVVVAAKQVDFNTLIRQIRQSPQQTRVSLGHGVPVLKPKIKQIPHQIQGAGVRSDGSQPRHQLLLPEATGGRGGGPQMGVGYKEIRSAHNQRYAFECVCGDGFA